MPQADLFTVRRYSGIINICREKKKQLAVLHTCNDHEKYTQHLYIFFFSLSYKPSLYPQRVKLLEVIRDTCCVMVYCTNTEPTSRDSSGYNLSWSLYFEKFSRFSESYSKYIQAFLLKGKGITLGLENATTNG